MTATSDSSLGHGTVGSPQGNIEEHEYPALLDSIESGDRVTSPPTYIPSPKHEEGHNWGSENPIKTQTEGQHLLDTGYRDGKQVYNVTDSGIIVKFQPDNTPQNGYHSYEVSKPRDIPASVLKKLLNDGKITRSQYNRLRKGKR